MEQSPRLSLSYIAPNQAQKHLPVNESLRRLDALAQLTVRSRRLAAPPPMPADGDAYILPAEAIAGLWDTFSGGDIAVYQDGAWAKIGAVEGFCAYVADEGALIVYNGAAWVAVSTGGGETAPRFGINANADDINRLAVKSDAILFNYDDITPGTGDCRIKVNKDAVGDTASHLFQTGFSGRAEFGLTGSDDFQIKVSANGSSWIDALMIDKDTGFVQIGSVAPAVNFEVNQSTHVVDSAMVSNDVANFAGQDIATGVNIAAASSVSAGHRPGIKGTRARGTLSSPEAVQDGDLIFFFLSVAHHGTGAVASAGIDISVDGAVSTGSVPQKMEFKTGSTARATRMTIFPDGGVTVGAPTGGSKGAGALNAVGVYDDNTLLTCYVFDQALDGLIDEKKWDDKVPDRIIPEEKSIDLHTGEVTVKSQQRREKRAHAPMRKFKTRQGTKYDPLTLDGYALHWKEKRHLSSMPNEATFDPENGLAAGEWIQRLVETVEIQAVLIEALNGRVKLLEKGGPGRRALT